MVNRAVVTISHVRERSLPYAAMPCGTNLESSGQNVRLRMGVAMLGLSLLGTVLIVQSGLHWAWRILLFMPFFMAAFGAWQGLFRICPGLAFKGVRENAAGGEDRIGRQRDLVQARRMARLVLGGATATAMLSTAVVTFIP